MPTNPKVFVSHSSADKQRFVLDFANKLRQKGVDAWIDKWEMSPGDSLVDKIFEEGIKDASAMIIVLSKHSVENRWVREEMNAGFVKRVNQGSRLIPVILDDCKVPECLQSTLWQKITNLSEFDEELDRIVSAIYGKTDKPPLGNSPTYASTLVDCLPQLSPLDTFVLLTSCRKILREDIRDLCCKTEIVLEETRKLNVPDSEVFDALEVLAWRSWIDPIRLCQEPHISSWRVTNHSLDTFLRKEHSKYPETFTRVCAEVVNSNARTSSEISKTVSASNVVVNAVLGELSGRGLIEIERLAGAWIWIRSHSPELKRMLGLEYEPSRHRFKRTRAPAGLQPR